MAGRRHLIGWLWIVRATAIIFAPEYVMLPGSKIDAGGRLCFGAAVVDLIIGI